MDDDEDLGFVPDDPGDDLGFVPDDDSRVPSGMRPTGDSRTVVQLGETTVEGDPRGRRGSVSYDPSGEGIVEERLVEPKPSASKGAPETRGLLERIEQWATGRDPMALGGSEHGVSIAGMQLPGRVSVGRAAQTARRGGGASDVISALLPSAPRGAPGERVEGQDFRYLAPSFGATDAATLGWADEVAGDADVSEMAQEQAPGAAAVGALGGSLPYALIPAGAATSLGRVGVATGLGLGMGTVRGAGESEASLAEDPGQVARDAVVGGVTEGALSGALAGAGEAAAPVARRVGSWLSRRGDAVEETAARLRNAAAGVRSAEFERMVDDPVRFAQVVREQGINRGLGSTRAAGARGQEVRETANREVTNLIDQANEAASAARQAAGYRDGAPVPGTVSVEGLARRLGELRDSLRGQGAPAVGARSRIDEMISRYSEATPDGSVGIDDLMADWRAAGRPQNFRDGQPWNVLAEQGRGLRRAFRELIEDAMESASGPGAREALADALERVHVGRTVARGAEQQAQRATTNRLISPTDYLSAGAGGAAGMMSGDPMTGMLAAGGMALANRAIRGREHALVATVLERIVPVLQSANSPALQRAAAALQGAMQQGQPAVAAAHFLLSQTNPEYRQAVNAAREEE